MRFALLVLVGCGTTTFIPIDDGGGTSDAPAEAGSSDSGDACAALKVQIDMLRAKLAMCSNPGSGGQCQQVISDVCCSFSTSSDNTTMFEAMVSQYKSMCKPVCPGLCANPQKVCDQSLMCR